MKNGKPLNSSPIVYRAALLVQGRVEYKRGNLAPVLKWASEKTALLVPGSFRLTIVPVDYLLPWEKENG